MSKVRRATNFLTCSALLAATVSVAAVTPAEATVGSSLNVPWVEFGNPGFGATFLPKTMGAGDCRLKGADEVPSNWASITLGPTSTPNQYLLVWRFEMYTVSTHFGDRWRGTFVFKTANGGATVFTQTADGPNMEIANQLYGGEKQALKTLTPAQRSSIGLVDWIGDC